MTQDDPASCQSLHHGKESEQLPAATAGRWVQEPGDQFSNHKTNAIRLALRVVRKEGMVYKNAFRILQRGLGLLTERGGEALCWTWKSG
jgi:hypothetical protein